MNRAKRLLQSSVIVMCLYGLNKVTGFVRLILVGDEFGTGGDADAFTAANQLPELFYVLVAGGALAAALIPVYTDYLYSSDPFKAKKHNDLASTVMTLVIIALMIICGIAALFAPFITEYLLVPDYTAAQQQLTADLMRVILLNTILFGISGVISSLLNAHQHFILPALAPVALDLGYVIGVFFFVPSMGIFGLAWGTVIGALLHISIQLPGLIHYRLFLRPKFAFEIAGVREIGWLMLPRIIMLGAIQLADLFIIRVASSLPEGAVSGYFYAFTLMQLPETLFGTAIAIVVFPTLSDLFNKGEIIKMKEMAVRTLGIVWQLTIPSAALLVLIGRPAIQFILERGEFDADSTALVYRILLFFSIRIIAEATLEIVARLFYARHNTFTPMLTYLLWLVISVVLTYALFDPLGIAGVALASTVAFSVLSTVLFILNHRELGGLIDRLLVRSVGRALIGTIVMSLVVWGIGRLNLPTFPFLIVATAAAICTYLAVNLLLGGDELKGAYRLLRPKP